MLRANPAVLARLEAANRVLTQELAVIEQLNEPKRLSAKVGERFIAQLDGAAAAAEAGGGGGGVQQRFESAVAVPAECSEGCKGKWKTLSEVYGKYFACRPTCDEDVLREKTAASEGLDDECMKEQKCWEKIEESIFTKPDAAASTAAPSPPSSEGGSGESGGSGGSGTASNWAIERCSACCANGQATKSTSYKDGKKKRSCKTGNAYRMYGEKTKSGECAANCGGGGGVSASGDSSTALGSGKTTPVAPPPPAGAVPDDAGTALGSSKNTPVAPPPPAGAVPDDAGTALGSSKNPSTPPSAPPTSGMSAADTSPSAVDTLSIEGQKSTSGAESPSASEPESAAETSTLEGGGSISEAQSPSASESESAYLPDSDGDASSSEAESATGPEMSGSGDDSPGFGDAAPPMVDGHCKSKSDCGKGEYCDTEARDSNEHTCAQEVAANDLCKNSEMCEDGMVCLGGE
jgi:hypothetical protein